MEKKSSYNKSNLNFLIDALLLLVFSAIIGIGFMIKYVLLTGEQKREIFGINFEQTFLGLDRHGWGDIHLYLGFIFFGLLLLHIISHWSMIIAMFKKFFENLKMRKTVAIVFLSLCLMLIVLPFFIHPLNGEIEGKQINRGHSNFHSDSNDMHQMVAEDKTNINKSAHEERQLNIRGYMSIAEVCDNYKVPAKYLKEKLGLPASAPDNTALSTLRKQHGIKMSKVEEIIIGYTQKKTTKDN
jgi:hypothetical protein